MQNVAGEIENEHIYLMQVLEPTDDDKDAFSVKDLLWNSMACGYKFSPDKTCHHCHIAASDSRLLQMKFFVTVPAVLPICFQRVQPGCNRPIKTRIVLDLTMDMSRVIGGTDGVTSIMYTIKSWVIWTGRTVLSGHYMASIRNGENTVLEIDDTRIMEKNLSVVLGDKKTQKRVKMAMYVREECTRNAELTVNKLDVSLESREDIANIVMGECVGPTELVVREEILGTVMGGNMSGQVIDCFLSRIATKTSKKVVCFNSYLYTELSCGNIEKAVVKEQ